MILRSPFPRYWLQCHHKHVFPYVLLTFKSFAWKEIKYSYILHMYETGFSTCACLYIQTAGSNIAKYNT